jgi:hypothetical protein
MVIDSIREFLERDPFQPFRMRASSGAGYDVWKPGLVVILKSQVLVAEPRSDRYAVVPFLHIAGLELLSNGRHAGRPRRPRR